MHSCGMQLVDFRHLTLSGDMQMPGGDVTLQAHASEEADTPTLHPGAASKVLLLAEPLTGLAPCQQVSMSPCPHLF